MGAVTGIDTKSLASCRPGSEQQAITTASNPSFSASTTAVRSWFIKTDVAGRKAVLGTLPERLRTVTFVSDDTAFSATSRVTSS